MPLIHHVITGQGRPAVVFVHGFGCAQSDWDAQVAHLSRRYQTIAVDLRGHGASPGTPDECSIERYGADVAEVMETLALPPATLIGHMGCRVAVEAAFQATDSVAGTAVRPAASLTGRIPTAILDIHVRVIRRSHTLARFAGNDERVAIDAAWVGFGR